MVQPPLAVQVVEALQGISVPFGSFDILQDQAVREGMKVEHLARSLSVTLCSGRVFDHVQTAK